MERIELTAQALITCRGHTTNSVSVSFGKRHVCLLAFNAVFAGNTQCCREFVKNLGREPPVSSLSGLNLSKDLEGYATAYLLFGTRMRRENINSMYLNQHLRINKCFVDLMYDFTEALRQLDNVPRLIASLSKREKTENLFFKVLGASASVGIAEEDL